MEQDVVLAGFGGQGIRFCSKLLAHAGNMEGRIVLQYAVYGNAMRGGPIRSTVIFSDEEIGAPMRSHPWGVMAMDRRSLDLYAKAVQRGGCVVVNSSLAPGDSSRDDVRWLAVPATDLAKDLGNTMAAGMVALGALAELTGIVSLPTLERAIDELLPSRRRNLLELNQRALQAGADLARRARA